MEKKIESFLNNDLADLLRQAVQKKYEMTEMKYYPAKVVAIDDPMRLGRVRVRVFGVFGDTIPDEELPWALPFDSGSFNVPQEGALVNVLFENDDIYRPKYSGKVANLHNLKEMTAGYDEDYPESIVFFETENGDYFKINRKSLEMTFRHASGFIVKVNKSGDITIDNKATKAGDININIRGNVNLVSNGNVEVSAATGISLKTMDSSLWRPNVIDVCPFTMLPHGGSTAGITKLNGG
jgi:hypothetical protein